jgi:protocatechuate 3,4-dioxygenase beta subunit
VGMCGNYLQGVRQGDWFRFETLKPGDLQRAQGMTRATHPHLIHTFTCVTWDAVNKVTKHILSTGTPRGIVDYPLITREGYAFIPWRHVVEE